MKVQETLQFLGTDGSKKLMATLYGPGREAEAIARYGKVVEGFEKTFGDQDLLLFTSPGRTEISGNQTITTERYWPGAST